MYPDNKGVFIISLDFELLWGVRDKKTIESYGENIRGVRKVIPALLDLFDRYNVHATFATVGFLFAKNKTELLQTVPAILPQYSQQKYSPYENDYLQNIGENEQEDIYHYAGSLIDMIMQHPTQEIATHTHSHYYCLEDASLNSFRDDLKAAIKLADARKIELKSIVFPRNQYSDEHIRICKELGIIAYRGNESSTVYNPRKNEEQNKFIRATRLADSYINVTGHHTFKIADSTDIVNIPASRFLRPYSAKLKFADPLRLKRIKDSMSYAAANNECYHLWWHPHNFGMQTEENLSFLEEILKHFQRLEESGKMESKTMRSIAEDILIKNAGEKNNTVSR